MVSASTNSKPTARSASRKGNRLKKQVLIPGVAALAVIGAYPGQAAAGGAYFDGTLYPGGTAPSSNQQGWSWATDIWGEFGSAASWEYSVASVGFHSVGGSDYPYFDTPNDTSQTFPMPFNQSATTHAYTSNFFESSVSQDHASSVFGCCL